MPTIEMSAGLVTGLPSRICRLTDNLNSIGNAAQAGMLGGGSNVNTGYGFTAACTHLFIMKGTPPATPTLASVNSRLSDMLVRFVANASASGGDFLTSQVNTNPVVISTQYVAAAAAGTATWFLLATMNGSTSSATMYADYTVAPLYQMIGTVGVTGSGADFEMPSVSIVSGEQYRVMNLRVQIPTSWTY